MFFLTLGFIFCFAASCGLESSLRTFVLAKMVIGFLTIFILFLENGQRDFIYVIL